MMYFSTLVCSLLLASVDSFQISCEQATDVEIGKDVTFNCTFECDGTCTPTVKWEKDHDAGILYEYKESKSDFSKQHANYSGRIEVSTDSINNGKVFLTLKNVSIWDEGTYIFRISTDGGFGKEDVHLSVWANMDDIHIFWESDSEVLSCMSSGWYPAPEVKWKDKFGNDLNEHSEKILMRESNGYFNVSHSLKLFDEQNQYICSIWHKWMDKPKQTRVIFSDGKSLISVDDGEKSSDL
ncbi:V-set domain-containing T-cell activation inhibitor 1 [Pristis pectinata]|uniref:V-set domain-containing T-cell activation inhibitor 1 n=1 Tax=Pristis pectinata TaxID=685728 RepID=UPI00223E83D2|nr:V-set domain-containing T-cell activation inhibitor 1 [Pristis pectinata]XP_051869733.1 V-set domain-containing T-cell activation inhibitor 1 [Pristis pectinata]